MKTPAWVNATLALAGGTVTAASIAFIGYVFERYARVQHGNYGERMFTDGVWWCVGGVFGNACWVPAP